LRRALIPILERYGVQKAILFGSLARGDATRRSDLALK
jgi:predicted nucleotidyltransferase